MKCFTKSAILFSRDINTITMSSVNTPPSSDAPIAGMPQAMVNAHESVENQQAFTLLLWEVISWIQEIYTHNQRFTSIAQCNPVLVKFLNNIISRAKELWIVFKEDKVLTYTVIELFKKYGYSFHPSSIPSKDGKTFLFNLWIFKIWRREIFEGKNIEVKGLPKPQGNYEIYFVDAIVTPDIRETDVYAGKNEKMIFDGLTMMDQQSGNNYIMIIEPNIPKVIEKTGGNIEDARKRAVLNEVFSVYFSQMIHNRFLSAPLSMFQLPMKWNIHSLSEALWDLWSLKYGRNFGWELKRILISTNLEYTVSREIMRKWIWFVLQKERIKVPPPWFNEEFLKRLSVHHPKKYKAFKDGVIAYYEQILVHIILRIKKLIEESGS